MKLRYLAAVGCKGNFDDIEIAERVRVQDRLGLSSAIIQTVDEMFTGEEKVVRHKTKAAELDPLKSEDDEDYYYDELSTPMRASAPVYNDTESCLLDKIADEWLALKALGDRSEAKGVTAEMYSTHFKELLEAKSAEEYDKALGALMKISSATETYASLKRTQRAEEEARLAKKAARGGRRKTA